MNGEALSAEQMDAIARLPTREVLYGRLVGMVASPLTGLASALNGLIDRGEALDYDSLTVLRLRKRREQARRDRIEGRRADPGSR